MSLSSLLVQRGVATMRQVEEALARQVIYGGDLITNLMEVTRVNEDAIASILAEEMKLAAAPAGELPVASERVRALVPPELATQRGAVPLSVEDDTLILAVAEALPVDAVEQLAFGLGMKVAQRAAPAVRVRQAIARNYGLPLERRMQRLLARLSGEPAPAGSMPPPLNALPVVIVPPMPPGAPPPPRSTSRTFPGAPPPGLLPVASPNARVEPADSVPSLPIVLPSSSVALGPTPDPVSPLALATTAHPPDPPTLEPSPPPALMAAVVDGLAALPEPAVEVAAPATAPSSADRRSGLLTREITQAARSSRRRRGPVTFEAAKREGEEAEDRDALLDLFFDFARQYFDYAALFLVHGDIGEGRDAFGPGAPREKVLGIGVPLDLPGLFATVRDQRASTITRAPAGGLEAELLADLGRAAGAEIAIVPLVVRTRVVAIFLGDCAETGVDRENVQQIVAFAAVIGKGFERIIVRRKLSGFVAGGRVESSGKVDATLVPAKSAAVVPSILPTTNTPPPPANIASVRPIGGPPIPREDPPSTPRPGRAPFLPAKASARSSYANSAPDIEVVIDEPEFVDDDRAAMELFDELGREGVDDDFPPPPPSAAIAVPAHTPPTPHAAERPVPSVIVDFEQELGALVDRVAAGTADEQVEGELLRQGERAMRVIMARFPGPLTIERSRITMTSVPPRPSECGPILRLVTRERRVALPFVVERLSDPDGETRGWATHVLCELPYAEAIDPLLPRLRDVDLGTRISAAHALAAIGRTSPEAVRAAVAQLAHDADAINRAAAARAMAELRDASLVPDLVRALADGNEAVEAAAHQALVQVTRQDFGLDARPWLRWWELNASRNRVEWLIDALTHEVSEVRRAAAEELRAVHREVFGYASDLPPRERERAQQRYRDWWATEGRAKMRHHA